MVQIQIFSQNHLKDPTFEKFQKFLKKKIQNHTKGAPLRIFKNFRKNPKFF